MKILLALAASASLLTIAGPAQATYADKLISYGGGGQGKVIFDGRTHAAAGILCNECHPGLFQTKRQVMLSMADHEQGKACFACHNGTRAFADCTKCHRK